MSVHVKEHKGFNIRVNGDGIFYAYDKEGNQIATSKTFSELKTGLDKLSKVKLGQSVFIAGNWGDNNFYPGKVTSVRFKEGYGYSGERKEFRVTWEGHHWKDFEADQIIKDNEENRKLVEEIQRLREADKAILHNIGEVAKKLQRYTENELTGEE